MPTPNGNDWKYVREKLLGNNVLIEEGLTDMQQLPAKGFTFIAFPLKMRKRDGSPAHTAAIIGSEEIDNGEG